MWYDFVGWIRIEFEIKNTILGSVFIILILSQMEKGVRYFLNELKKFDSVSLQKTNDELKLMR